MAINRNSPPIYDNSKEDFKDKKYRNIIFVPGRAVQNRELTGIGSYAEEKNKLSVRQVLGDNKILSGCKIQRFDLDNNIINLSNGTVIINGEIFDIQEGTVEYLAEGIENIYINITEQIITELDDEDLLDPASGYDNFNQPGAYRLKRNIGYSKTEPSLGLKIYTLDEGRVVWSLVEGSRLSPNPIPDEKPNLTDIYKTFGNYVLDRIRCFQIPTKDNTKIGLSTDRGKYIIGGIVYKLDSSNNKFYIDKNSEKINVLGELHQVGSSNEFRLNNSLATQIDRVQVPIEIEDKPITKGVLNGEDEVTTKSVYDILEVKQGITTYIRNIDWNVSGNVSGNKVNWLGEAQPITGTTYEVTFVEANILSDTEYEIDYGLEDQTNTSEFLYENPTIPFENIYNNINIGNIIIKDIQIGATTLQKNIDYFLTSDKLLIPSITENIQVPLEIEKQENSNILPFEGQIANCHYYTRTGIMTLNIDDDFSISGNTIIWNGERHKTIPVGTKIIVNITKNVTNDYTSEMVIITYSYEWNENVLDINYIIPSYLVLDEELDLAEGFHIIVDYKYELNRLDYIVLNSSGLRLKRGLSFSQNKYSTGIVNKEHEIPIGTYIVKPYSNKIIISELEQVRNIRMSDLNKLYKEVKDIKYNIALTNLDKEAKEKVSPTSLRGTYTDGFNSLRNLDVGAIPLYKEDPSFHTCIPSIFRECLGLPFKLNEKKLGVDLVSSPEVGILNDACDGPIGYTINPNPSIVTWSEQLKATKHRTLADGFHWDDRLKTFKLELFPNSVFHLDKKNSNDNVVILNYIEENVSQLAGPAENVSKDISQWVTGTNLHTETTVTSKWSKMEEIGTSFVSDINKKLFIPQDNIKVVLSNLMAGVSGIEVDFDGIPCVIRPFTGDPTLGDSKGTISNNVGTADSNGEFSCEFTIPPNIPYGLKDVNVKVLGYGSLNKTFWGMGIESNYTDIIERTITTQIQTDVTTETSQLCCVGHCTHSTCDHCVHSTCDHCSHVPPCDHCTYDYVPPCSHCDHCGHTPPCQHCDHCGHTPPCQHCDHCGHAPPCQHCDHCGHIPPCQHCDHCGHIPPCQHCDHCGHAPPCQHCDHCGHTPPPPCDHCNHTPPCQHCSHVPPCKDCSDCTNCCVGMSICCVTANPPPPPPPPEPVPCPLMCNAGCPGFYKDPEFWKNKWKGLTLSPSGIPISGCFTKPLAQTMYINNPNLTSTTLNDIPMYSDIWVKEVHLFLRTKYEGENQDQQYVGVGFQELTDSGIPYSTYSSPEGSTFLVKYCDDPTLVANVNGLTPTIFEYPSLLKLEGQKGYGLIAGSPHAMNTSWVVELGEKDITSGQQVKEEPHRGILMSSPNMQNWESFVMEDLAFRIKIADFSNGKTLVPFEGRFWYRSYLYYDEVDISTDFTDPLDRAHWFTLKTHYDFQNDKTNVVFEYSIDGENWKSFDLNTKVYFPDSYTPGEGTLKIRAVLLSANKYMTPVVNPNVILKIGTYNDEGIYISRKGLVGNYNSVNVYLDQFYNPEINEIKVYISPDDMMTWREVDPFRVQVLKTIKGKNVYQVGYNTILQLYKATIESTDLEADGDMTGKYYYKIAFTNLGRVLNEPSDEVYAVADSQNIILEDINFDPNATGFRVYRYLDPDGTTPPTDNTDFELIYQSDARAEVDGELAADAVTIPLKDSYGISNPGRRFPTSGRVKIGSEWITYTGRTDESLTGCTRGASCGEFSSDPVIHQDGEIVKLYDFDVYDLITVTAYQGGSGSIPANFDYERDENDEKGRCTFSWTDSDLPVLEDDDSNPILLDDEYNPSVTAFFVSSNLRYRIDMSTTDIEKIVNFPEVARLMCVTTYNSLLEVS